MTAVETISACENVCQDFSLLKILFSQGGLTFLAALLASGMALFIATKVYAEQKCIDRDNERLSEKREAYIRFLRAITRYQLVLASSYLERKNQGIEAVNTIAISEIYSLVVYAPKEVIRICSLYVDTLYAFERKTLRVIEDDNIKRNYKEDYKPSSLGREQAMLAIRRDLVDEEPSNAEAAIDAFFVGKFRDYAEREEYAEQYFLNLDKQQP